MHNLAAKLSASFTRLLPQLEHALQQLAIDITVLQQQQLLYYLQQLLFWNKAYNLTAIKDPETALVKHIFDSLAVVPHLPAGNLLDIGTGAGLPAVIIAICQPERTVTALDSNGKKIRFIKQMVGELGLKNLTPINERIEEHEATYAVITSRAFASLLDFVKVSEPRLTKAGEIWAMKGVIPQQDIDALTADWQIETLALSVPKLDEVRHLIALKPSDQ